MILLISMAVAGGDGPAICSAETSWMVRATSVTGETLAEGQRWSDTARGMESEARDALKKACKAAKHADEEPGWTRSEFDDCAITCVPAYSVDVRALVSSGEEELRAEVDKFEERVFEPIEACVREARIAEEPVPNPLTFHTKVVGKHLEGVPQVEGSPEFSECLLDAVTRPRFHHTGNVAIVVRVRETPDP